MIVIYILMLSAPKFHFVLFTQIEMSDSQVIADENSLC